MADQAEWQAEQMKKPPSWLEKLDNEDIMRDEQLQRQLQERLEAESQTAQMVNSIEAVKNKAKPSMPQMVSLEKLLHAESKLGFFKNWVKENFNDITQAMRPADWLNILWALQTQFGYDVNRMFREAVAPELLRDFE